MNTFLIIRQQNSREMRMPRADVKLYTLQYFSENTTTLNFTYTHSVRREIQEDIEEESSIEIFLQYVR